MQRILRDTYLLEITTQCRFATNAILGLNSVLSRMPAASREGDFEKSRTLHAEVFRSIHSFLTHASNVSRMIWPTPPRRRPGEARQVYLSRCASDPKLLRGAALRETLGIPEHGHVLRSRRMRDHLEHFDERLDEWSKTSVRRNYVQDYIGPVGGIAGIDPSDMMRWFDPSTNHLRFRGEQYDLQALVDGVSDLRKRADQITSERFK